MEYIIGFVIIYLSVGFIYSCFMAYLLWAKGHYEQENHSGILGTIWMMVKLMFLWGTIPFSKKAKPDV